MIDVSKIRSKAKLQEMQKDFEYFIREPVVKQVYLEDYGWNETDYLDDVEEVTEALEIVKKRIEQLSQPAKTRGSRFPVREKVKNPGASTSVGAHGCDPCTSPDTCPPPTSPPL